MIKNTKLGRYCLFLFLTLAVQFLLVGLGLHNKFKSELYSHRISGEVSEEVLRKVLSFFAELSNFSFYISLLILMLSVVFVFGDDDYSKFQKALLISISGFFLLFKMFLMRAA